MFGGTDGKSEFNDLHSFDLTTGEWICFKQVEFERLRPPPSAHCSLVYFGGQLIILCSYKGVLKPFTVSNLGTEDMYWGQQVPNPRQQYDERPVFGQIDVEGKTINARFDFSCNVVNDKIYIFGGRFDLFN